jgi:hypothetical protein
MLSERDEKFFKGIGTIAVGETREYITSKAAKIRVLRNKIRGADKYWLSCLKNGTHTKTGQFSPTWRLEYSTDSFFSFKSFLWRYIAQTSGDEKVAAMEVF